MGLFNFLLGVMVGKAVSNTKRNSNQHLSYRQNSNNHYYGGCYDDIECSCDDYYCDYEARDDYGYCDEECEDRY